MYGKKICNDLVINDLFQCALFTLEQLSRDLNSYNVAGATKRDIKKLLQSAADDIDTVLCTMEDVELCVADEKEYDAGEIALRDASIERLRRQVKELSDGVDQLLDHEEYYARKRKQRHEVCVHDNEDC